MKRTPFLAIVLLAFAFPAHAQDAMKKDAAVKPADPESKVVLDSWNEIGRKLTAMAEDFPEDKYDFKPTPAQRSFAEQLLHAAGSCYYFTNPAMGLKPPAAEDPKRDQYKSKAVNCGLGTTVHSGAESPQYVPGEVSRSFSFTKALFFVHRQHRGPVHTCSY